MNNPSEEGKTADISALNQRLLGKMEVLSSITEEEAVLDAELGNIAFAALEEQYIEAKLVAFPDLSRMFRLSHELIRAHRRYDEVYCDIQSLKGEIDQLKLEQTCGITLLPVSSQRVTEELLRFPCAEVCGRVRFEAWEWVLVKEAGICVWVRCGVPVLSLNQSEMVEKYLEAEKLLASRPHLPSDLVLAVTHLLTLLPNTSL
jgi:hypothetical protein